MKKYSILLLIVSCFSFVSAQVSWSNSGNYDQFFFYEGNFLVQHKAQSCQLSIITKELQTHAVQHPDFGNFLANNIINLDDDRLGVLFNTKKEVRLYYLDKNSYTIGDKYVTISNLSSLFYPDNIVCKLFYSPDSSYLYLQCRYITYVGQFRLPFIKSMKHIVLDKKMNILWTREDLEFPVENSGIRFSAINNEGTIFLTFTGARVGFGYATYHDFLVYFDENSPVKSLKMGENEMFSVPILAIDNRNVILAGMVRKSGRDDSYFASWLINTEDNIVIEGTMEKLNLKSRENYLGDDDPTINVSVTHAVYEYFVMPDYYILFKKFDGFGNEANGVIVDINTEGKMEHFSFLNNCQCGFSFSNPMCGYMATNRNQSQLQFVYEDHINNLREGNTELYEIDNDKPMEHCMTYAQYNTQTKELEKRSLFVYGQQNIRAISHKYIYDNVFYFVATIGKKGKAVQVGKVDLGL
jgi:hypothetical protein